MTISDLSAEEQRILEEASQYARAHGQNPSISFIIGYLQGMISRLLEKVEK